MGVLLCKRCTASSHSSLLAIELIQHQVRTDPNELLIYTLEKQQAGGHNETDINDTAMSLNTFHACGAKLCLSYLSETRQNM